MIRHYLTLLKQAEEFSKLNGCRIVECFSQDKNSFVIGLYDGEEIRHLYFSGDTRLGCIYLKRNFKRAKKNSADLMQKLLGQELQDVRIADNDRIVIFKTNDYFINIILFGGSKNNVIVTNKNNRIIDAFKSADKINGQKLTSNARDSDFKSDGLTVGEYIDKFDFTLGKHYIKQFLTANEIDAATLWDSIPEVSQSEMLNNLAHFKNEILDSNVYCLLENQSGDLLFSLIELNGWEVIEKFQSINIGIERRVRKDLIEGNLGAEKRIVLKKLISNLKRAERSIADIDKSRENLKRAADYRLWGEMLMSQMNQKDKPGKSIILEDWEGNLIEIKLDDKQTINENAQRYFKKAKDSETNYKIRKEMIPSLTQKAEKIRDMIALIENTDNVKDLTKITGEKSGMNDSENFINERESKFRQFDLGEGYILYVGKNAANNDELTVKFARPNDMWFHARGSSGSHAVLRLNKDQKPPKYILQKAASVAAYYSGAKNGKYVPVAYCLKKFVHKPKGANVGAVVVRREEVIMVEPSLPVQD